jgi:hypothetical protein
MQLATVRVRVISAALEMLPLPVVLGGLCVSVA